MIRSPFFVLGGAFFVASLTSGVLICSAPQPADAGKSRPQSEMTDAARRFLETLTPAQRQEATFPFQSEERLNFQFRRAQRKGLPLKAMNAAQRSAAMELLRTGVSARGYEKAALIREMEKVPPSTERPRAPEAAAPRNRPPAPPPDPEGYFFSIFGEPSATSNWAWRYEGHHCAMNWTLVAGKPVASSPQFFGSEPAEMRMDIPGAPKRGTRPLAGEEELARKLLESLTTEQRGEAVVSAEAPTNIVTGAERQAGIQEDTGIAYGRLSPAQRGMLLTLIREYTDNQSKVLADKRVAALRKAGLEKVKFAWLGSVERGQGHYYRVQGPTFLIEYDNTQSNANHIHSVWRDFKGDFGMDLLAMHYRATPHRIAAAR